MEHDHGTHFLFHPVLVHFPIAFYVLELILLIFWVVRQDQSYLRFALFSFRWGYGLMIATMIAGVMDAGGFDEIVGQVRTHALAASSVFILYTIRAFFWRYGKKEAKSYALTHLLFAAAGNILIAVTGYFGGVLVYGIT